MLAAAGANMDKLACLLEAGLDPNSKSKEGRTALHYICRIESFEGFVGTFGADMVWILIEKGADVNAQDHEGNAPLHDLCNLCISGLEVLALQSRNAIISSVKLLISAGADINITNGAGMSPADRLIQYLRDRDYESEKERQYLETVLQVLRDSWHLPRHI